MKTTTTIMDIIQSELINAGHNEFVNKINGITQLTLTNDKYTFIRKVGLYDEDVQKVVNRTFFMNFALVNADADLFFKKSFIQRFMDRELANQTVEVFANHLISNLAMDEVFITNLYLNMQKYLTGEKTNNSHSLHGENTANIDLPQDNVSLDLHKDTADYANNNMIQRGYNDNNGLSNEFNPAVLNEIKDQWEQLMLKYDKKLFLQIW